MIKVIEVSIIRECSSIFLKLTLLDGPVLELLGYCGSLEP